MNNDVVPGHSIKEGGYGDNKALEGIGLSCDYLNVHRQPSRMGVQTALTSRAVSKAMPCPLIRLYSLAGNTVLRPSRSFARRARSLRSTVLSVHRRFRRRQLTLLGTHFLPNRSTIHRSLNLVRPDPRDLACFNREFHLGRLPAESPRTCPGSAVSSSSSMRNSGTRGSTRTRSSSGQTWPGGRGPSLT